MQKNHIIRNYKKVPAKQGRNYTPIKSVRCALPMAFLKKLIIFTILKLRKIITGNAMPFLRWL